jgi:hypothetical protein
MASSCSLNSALIIVFRRNLIGGSSRRQRRWAGRQPDSWRPLAAVLPTTSWPCRGRGRAGMAAEVAVQGTGLPGFQCSVHGRHRRRLVAVGRSGRRRRRFAGEGGGLLAGEEGADLFNGAHQWGTETTVVFLSTPISAGLCRLRSCNERGGPS